VAQTRSGRAPVALSGEPIALLFNYAVHSAVALGTGSLSGDLAGAAERYVDTPYFETNGTPLARGCAENGIVDGLVGLINEHL